HEVAQGAADRSYGIHVAKLAGLPAAVLTRAEAVLATLEKGEQRGQLAKLADDLPLFNTAAPTAPAAGPSPVDALLDTLRPDELAPKDALEFLYKLKGLLDSRG
ncbi:MAG: MutS-related protein, partial [Stellaceae bacterium]